MGDYCIRIKGGIRVSAPSSPEFLTTWVLLEQEDWFEPEIAFVRSWLKPGMRVIDIGANYGVYALTMAKAVAPGGHVWAFEPARSTASMLRLSMERNGLANLELIDAALSDREGQATLNVYPNSEMNSLTMFAERGAAASEEVAVSTLDRQQQTCDWGGIDFVKMDAEGEELKILAGGAEFFAGQSPLVMFEIPSWTEKNNRDLLLTSFRKLGYGIYRLIGGARVLVPSAGIDSLDPFTINLFACKPDRAARLAASGCLVERAQPPHFTECGEMLLQRQRFAPAFGSLCPAEGAYLAAFNAYATWRNSEAPLGQRYAALRAALEAAKNAAAENRGPARLSTLARIAAEAGERYFAMKVVAELTGQFKSGFPLPAEPFFPAASRYDSVDPQGHPAIWFAAASAEAFELWRRWSGYYLTIEDQNLPMLDWLMRTPFASAEIARRRQLQRLRAGLQEGLVAEPILIRETAENLNPALWAGR